MLEWISYHVEKNKYDASAIDFSCCNMDGYTLCQYSRDQLGIIFGSLGDVLYDRLHEISKCECLAATAIKLPSRSCRYSRTEKTKCYPGLEL